jgi:hypothetical protein
VSNNTNELDHGARKGNLLRRGPIKSSTKDGSGKRSYSQSAEAMLDANALLVSKTVQSLMRSGKLRFPRSGFLVRMNRGKIIVQRSE